jgi:hypothetical protein
MLSSIVASGDAVLSALTDHHALRQALAEFLDSTRLSITPSGSPPVVRHHVEAVVLRGADVCERSR